MQKVCMKSKNTIVQLILIAGLAGLLQAQNAYDAIHKIDNENGFGTRALAMGGAYTGLADDYSALYWNPAGLGYVHNSQFSVELSHLNFQNEANYSGAFSMDNQTYTRLRSLGFVRPVPTARGSCVIALGYNKISDYDENLYFSGYSSVSNGIGFYFADENEESKFYLFDKDVLRTEQISSAGGLHHWSLAGAIALSPQFMAGATVALITGKEDYNFRFSQRDINDLFDVYPGDIDEYEINQYLISDIRGLGIKLGGNLQLSRWLRLGGTIKLPTYLTVNETYSSDDLITFDDGSDDGVEDSGRWKYTIKTPYYFDGGVAFTGHFLTLSASARYRDWSQTQFSIPKNQLAEADYRDLIIENSIIRNDYRETIEYHLGGEIKLPFLRTNLRGGYAYFPNPLMESDKTQDKQIYTSGLSLTVDRNINLDVAYLFSDWSRVSEDQFTPAGTLENISISKIIIGLSYTF